MKKAKKLLVLILCLSMVFIFVGCGQQQTASTSDSEDEWETEIIEGEENVTGGEVGEMDNTTVQQGDSSVTAALAKNKEFLDSLKNFEITIYSMKSEKYTRGTTSGDRYFAILSKVARKYGVTINYLDKSPGGLQQSILAGTPAANVIGIQDYHFIRWMNAGVAADLTAAMKKTGITFKESWYVPDATKMGNMNGKQYAFNAEVYEPYMLVYNQRIMQESGLTDPIELYKSGKWTFDKLGEYLKKLKKTSADGNVITDGLGITSSPMLAGQMIGRNGAEAVTIKDGKMVQNFNDSKVKKALSYFSQWYSIDKTIKANSDWKAAYTSFSNGNIAMVLGSKYIFENMSENNMTDAVGVVPFPYGPDASAKTEYTYDQIFMNVIPKSEEKNADKILFIMNEVYKEQYAVREDDFADSYRTLIRNTDSYNLFKDYTLGKSSLKLSNWNISGILYPDSSGAGGVLMNMSGALSTGTAVETAIKTYSTSAETNLNEVWGKWKITG